MRQLFHLLLVLIVLAFPAAEVLAADTGTLRTGIIAPGLPSETPYYIQSASEEGPTVLIIGGMHGNEPAGALAAEQIRHWPIQRGTLVVIPRANPPALEANTRRIPGKPRAAGDLNRNFPATQSDRGVLGPTAKHLWAFISEIGPDWVLDLHEGFDFHTRNPRSVGSSIIHFDAPDINPYVQRMLDAVNVEIEDEEKVFPSIARGPRETGLIRAASHFLGARGMVLETTWADQEMSLRVRQHRLMVHALLHELGMVSDRAAHIMLPEREAASAGDHDLALRIALYDGPGAGESGVNAMTRITSSMPDAVLHHMSAADIRDGALDRFDVVVFPGGRGGAQGQALGEQGRAQVRAFVESGGGYLGICAGAYLATARLDSYLKMVGTYHHRPWQLGRGPVEIELTEHGRDILSADESTFEVRYGNGPIFVHERGLIPDLDLPEYAVLATFTRGVEKDGQRQRVMEGTPAIIAAPFGMGRILLISPHPESHHELSWMLENAMTWLAMRQPADSPDTAEACPPASGRPMRSERRRRRSRRLRTSAPACALAH